MPELRDVSTDQQDQGLAANLVIDRDTASRLGITASAIDQVLYDAFGQREVSTMYTGLNQYFVVMEVDPQYQLSPDSLNNIYVKASNVTGATHVPMLGEHDGAASTTAAAATVRRRRRHLPAAGESRSSDRWRTTSLLPTSGWQPGDDHARAQRRGQYRRHRRSQRESTRGGDCFRPLTEHAARHLPRAQAGGCACSCADTGDAWSDGAALGHRTLGAADARRWR